jgi:thiopurine S-methyltransferase
MEPHFWHERWTKGEIGFHMDSPHENLMQFFSGLPPGKVMVPLCGKTPDLLWLRSQGHEVVGVELSPIACESFFKENKLSVQTKNSPHHQVYQGDGITLLQGDFFQVPPEVWKSCNYLYDRAALIALPPEMRKRYAQYILEHWVDGKTMLLITLSTEPNQTLGPPFSVPESEVRELYGKHFRIDLLLREKNEQMSGSAPRFENTLVFENTFRLER